MTSYYAAMRLLSKSVVYCIVLGAFGNYLFLGFEPVAPSPHTPMTVMFQQYFIVYLVYCFFSETKADVLPEITQDGAAGPKVRTLSTAEIYFVSDSCRSLSNYFTYVDRISLNVPLKYIRRVYYCTLRR